MPANHSLLEAREIAQTILGVNLVGYDPERVPHVPEDAIDGIEAWAERLAWLVLSGASDD